MTERNSQNIERKSTQIIVIDKSIICSVDVSLRSSGARIKRNLQSTVPSATALRQTVFVFAFPTANFHSISGRERLLLSVAVTHSGLIDLTLLDEAMKLSKKI